MHHTGILPHHTRWTRLFENLRYIVIDELHTYRGVFGSHLCNVLRRLRRIARFYGRHPQFICCSATIANPGDLASRLLESEVEVLNVNCAPGAGEAPAQCWGPPLRLSIHSFFAIPTISSATLPSTLSSSPTISRSSSII